MYIIYQQKPTQYKYDGYKFGTYFIPTYTTLERVIKQNQTLNIFGTFTC